VVVKARARFGYYKFKVKVAEKEFKLAEYFT
jgi:hypothetical protein